MEHQQRAERLPRPGDDPRVRPDPPGERQGEKRRPEREGAVLHQKPQRPVGQEGRAEQQDERQRPGGGGLRDEIGPGGPHRGPEERRPAERDTRTPPRPDLPLLSRREPREEGEVVLPREVRRPRQESRRGRIAGQRTRRPSARQTEQEGPGERRREREDRPRPPPPPRRVRTPAPEEFGKVEVPVQLPPEHDQDREQHRRAPGERHDLQTQQEQQVALRRDQRHRHRQRPQPRPVEGEDDGERIRREEVPVVHLRQQERNDQHRERRQRHQQIRGERRPAPLHQDPDRGHREDGERRPDRPVGVEVVRDPLVEVRRALDQVRELPGLVGVGPQHLVEVAPEDPGGEEGRQVRDRRPDPVAQPVHLPLRREPEQQRQEEDRRPLERERQPEGGEGPGRPPLQQEVEAGDQEGRVDRVRLPPHRPVQDDRRGEERGRGGGEGRSPGLRPAERHAAVHEVRQGEVEGHRDRLDGVHRRERRGEFGDPRQQGEPGHVVEPEVVPEGREAAVLQDEGVPVRPAPPAPAGHVPGDERQQRPARRRGEQAEERRRRRMAERPGEDAPAPAAVPRRARDARAVAAHRNRRSAAEYAPTLPPPATAGSPARRRRP